MTHSPAVGSVDAVAPSVDDAALLAESDASGTPLFSLDTIGETYVAPVETVQKVGFSHESTANESIEWYTPPEIFKALDMVFDLDPCSPGEGKSFVPAKRHYTIVDDGLASPWEGTCWVNPPYGSETRHWMKKLAEHGDGMALVFARTDVRWFQFYGVQADLICFVSQRVRFYQGSTTSQGGTPGAGSMILAYGAKAAEALRASNLGACFSFVASSRPDAQMDLFADLDADGEGVELNEPSAMPRLSVA